MRALALFVFLMLVAACGAPDEGGRSETTTSSLSTTSTTLVTTTTTASVESLIVLRADGLGALEFGEPIASVMEALESLIGPPVPGEEDPYEGHPLRYVYWENVGLAVIFSDYEFYRDDGVEHLAGWIHSRYVSDLAGWDHDPTSLPLQTAEGVGIGATLSDLQSAYPGQVVLEAECDPGGQPTAAYVRFSDPDDGGSNPIRFGFESLPIGPNSRISYIGAGAGPGC